MACQFFGPYDPANDPKDTIEKWMKSCPSAGGDYPRACLDGKGIYMLYCCSAAGDYPCSSPAGGAMISLPGALAMELDSKGHVELFDGKVTLTYNRRSAG